MTEETAGRAARRFLRIKTAKPVREEEQDGLTLGRSGPQGRGRRLASHSNLNGVAPSVLEALRADLSELERCAAAREPLEPETAAENLLGDLGRAGGAGAARRGAQGPGALRHVASGAAAAR